MYVSFLTILASWIFFSTILVTIILVNSSRMSRTDNPDFGSGQSIGELRKKRIDLVNWIKMLID